MKKFCFIIMAMAFLGSCATVPRPTREQIEMADCGPLPLMYEKAIKAIIEPYLLDPYSAIFTFTHPQKGWNKLGSEPIYGWFLCGTINAKNRMGGYVGAKPFYAMIKNEIVVNLVHEGITIPDSFFLGAMSANRGFYEGICGGQLIP